MRKRFTTTMAEETIRELKIMAITQDKDVSELITDMLKIYKLYLQSTEQHRKK